MTRKRHTLRSADEIVEAGLAPEVRRKEMADVARRYAVAISPAMAELIDPADPDDPIARQFIPDIRELDRHPAERADPIGDGLHSPVRGIVHRYPDRVLLKIVGVCPVYCRFCFRREMVGPDSGASLGGAETAAAIAYIRTHPEIWEVILTGGDPLILSSNRIRELTTELAAIPHVKVLRWHTRIPVVAPERVTADLVAALACRTMAVYVSLHANHPREITAGAGAPSAPQHHAGL
jgi:lysine 2,3-aminomutase